MYNNEGKRVGFKLIKEATDNTATVEQVRDMLISGLGDNVLEYDGRISNRKTDETVELMFTTIAHQNDEKEQRERAHMSFLQKIKEEKELEQNF